MKSYIFNKHFRIEHFRHYNMVKEIFTLKCTKWLVFLEAEYFNHVLECSESPGAEQRQQIELISLFPDRDDKLRLRKRYFNVIVWPFCIIQTDYFGMAAIILMLLNRQRAKNNRKVRSEHIWTRKFVRLFLILNLSLDPKVDILGEIFHKSAQFQYYFWINLTQILPTKISRSWEICLIKILYMEELPK